MWVLLLAPFSVGQVRDFLCHFPVRSKWRDAILNFPTSLVQEGSGNLKKIIMGTYARLTYLKKEVLRIIAKAKKNFRITAECMQN